MELFKVLVVVAQAVLLLSPLADAQTPPVRGVRTGIVDGAVPYRRDVLEMEARADPQW
jgi:hypothetical protein